MCDFTLNTKHVVWLKKSCVGVPKMSGGGKSLKPNCAKKRPIVWPNWRFCDEYSLRAYGNLLRNDIASKNRSFCWSSRRCSRPPTRWPADGSKLKLLV